MLGLSRNADSEAVRRVYNRLVRENRGDDDAIARIENAHSTIMMSQLSARMKVPGCPGRLSQVRATPATPPVPQAYPPAAACMQGGIQVDKDIKYADKAVYFPWRPRHASLACLACCCMHACVESA